MSQLRFASILLAVFIGLQLGGCRLPFGFVRQEQSPSKPPTHGSSPAPAGDLSVQARDTVTGYLQALSDHDYARAYTMLSRDSQSQHTRANFEQVGKKGMPLYDFSTARTSQVVDNTATVEIRQIEDPATHGFHLVLEDSAWKIVYRGGSPGQPYAE